jgi:3-oxoacyl-[acyl-carrier protein] reductase
MIRTDLDSVFYCCRAAVPIMVAGRQGGRIINMSSATALTGMAGSTHYAAAKAGIIGLSKSLALELAQYLITVNAVAPGIIDTQLMRRRWATRPRPAIPWPRIGTVDDVAALVVFLASPGAEFITGQVISPNGGQVT